MTVMEALPADSPTGGERVGLIPVEHIGEFTLTGTEHSPATIYPTLIMEKLGGRSLIAFATGEGKIVELMHRKDETGDVYSVAEPVRTKEGATGTVHSFIIPTKLRGITLFESHRFYRRGTEERQSTPVPITQVASEVAILMASLHGPRQAKYR